MVETRAQKKKREAAEEIRHERERQRQREQDEMESKAKLLQQRLFHEHQASKLKKQKLQKLQHSTRTSQILNVTQTNTDM